MCEACQHIVEPLNTLVEDVARAVHPVVIVRADEQGCRAFLSVFPLDMPVVCDSDRTITMGLDVHRTPFGLLYDEHGTLIRKGLLEGFLLSPSFLLRTSKALDVYDVHG